MSDAMRRGIEIHEEMEREARAGRAPACPHCRCGGTCCLCGQPTAEVAVLSPLEAAEEQFNRYVERNGWLIDTADPTFLRLNDALHRARSAAS